MKTREYLLEGDAAARRYALAPPNTAPVNRTGTNLGIRAGSSLEFRDHRAYEPGDDLRHVDWNAYARSDQLSVKLYREESAPHLEILIDGSRSMDLAESAKARGTLALAGFFTAAAANAGFTHTGWLLGSDAFPLGDRARRAEAWETIDFDSRIAPMEAFTSAAARWRPNGSRVLLSDLLWDADPTRIVRQLADRAASVAVIQVLAATDANPPEGGHLQLVDSETDEIHQVRIDAARLVRYRDNLTRLQGHWHEACRAAGAVFMTVVAEDLLRDWRLDLLVAAGILVVE